MCSDIGQSHFLNYIYVTNVEYSKRHREIQHFLELTCHIRDPLSRCHGTNYFAV